MKKSLWLLLGLSGLLVACPKNASTSVSGSADDTMDAYAAKLEELQSQQNVNCAATCETKQQTCALSERICQVASESTNRLDFQKRCVASQESCALNGERCANCR
jgi:hypothetical protein